MDITQYTASLESIYALSLHRINQFFSRRSSLTQHDCDKAAEKLTGSRVYPSAVQGVASYTVWSLPVTTADGIQQPRRAIQFCESELSPINFKTAWRTYGSRFVPECRSHGMVSDVHVYEMDHVPGVAFSQARRQLLAAEMEPRLMQTVRDFAQFSAAAFRYNILPWPSFPFMLSDSYRNRLTQLRMSLPARFHPVLDGLLADLPLLFRPKAYPLVQTHLKLADASNIHVDPATGEITGIVDWTNADARPFGISVGVGLETLLGVRTARGWHFHPGHERLREVFWEAFYQCLGGRGSDENRRAVEVASMLGLFDEYGFEQGALVRDSPVVTEGDEKFMCLEALCLR